MQQLLACTCGIPFESIRLDNDNTESARSRGLGCLQALRRPANMKLLIQMCEDTVCTVVRAFMLLS